MCLLTKLIRLFNHESGIIFSWCFHQLQFFELNCVSPLQDAFSKFNTCATSIITGKAYQIIEKACK